MSREDVRAAQHCGLINRETMAKALDGDARAIAYTQWKLDGNDGPASPPDGWQEPVTAESLTDEEISEEMAHYTGADYGGFKWQRLRECELALIRPRADSDRSALARDRVAALINARREGSK